MYLLDKVDLKGGIKMECKQGIKIDIKVVECKLDFKVNLYSNNNNIIDFNNDNKISFFNFFI